MTATRRERWIAIGAVAAVALFVLDRWIVGPAWESYREDVALAEQAERDLAAAQQQVRREAALAKRWGDALAAGADLPIAQAESHLLQSLETWRRRTGINLRLTQPERDRLEWDARTRSRLGLVRCRVSAEGDVQAVRDLLHAVQSDPAPVCIESITIRSPDSKKDRLAVTMSVSWICQAPAERKESRR